MSDFAAGPTRSQSGTVGNVGTQGPMYDCLVFFGIDDVVRWDTVSVAS